METVNMLQKQTSKTGDSVCPHCSLGLFLIMPPALSVSGSVLPCLVSAWHFSLSKGVRVKVAPVHPSAEEAADGG